MARDRGWESGLDGFQIVRRMCCLGALLCASVSGALAANVDGDVPQEKRPPDTYDTLQRMQNDPRLRDTLQKLRDAGREMQKDQGLRDALQQILKSMHAVPAPCLVGTITTGGTPYYFFSGPLLFAESAEAEPTLQEHAPTLSRHLYELYYPEYERFVTEGGLDHLKHPNQQLDREQFARVGDMQRRFYVRLANSVGGKPEIIARLRKLVPEGVLKDVSFKARVALEPPQGCEAYRPAG